MRMHSPWLLALAVASSSLSARADDPPPPASATPDEEDAAIQVDALVPTARRERRFWQVEGLHELHANLVSDDRSGNDWTTYSMLRGNLNLTGNDQVALRMDLEQRFIADEGESGLWFGDMRLYYSRAFKVCIVPTFPVPAKASAYLTLPTSRLSQERGYVTKPTAALTLAPTFRGFTLLGNVLFQYAFAKWATSSMGDPNTQLTTGYSLQLFYRVFDWFSPSVAWEQYWNRDYRTREGESQPLQSKYYFELALNFSLPMPELGPTVDLSLAYAQGADVLEDGITRLYFNKRDQSELYLAVNVAY